MCCLPSWRQSAWHGPITVASMSRLPSRSYKNACFTLATSLVCDRASKTVSACEPFPFEYFCGRSSECARHRPVLCGILMPMQSWHSKLCLGPSLHNRALCSPVRISLIPCFWSPCPLPLWCTWQVAVLFSRAGPWRQVVCPQTWFAVGTIFHLAYK